MERRAVIYTRISRDSDRLGLGVERQRKDCMAFCHREGWEVVETFIENDLSAYRKRRPQYEAMLAMVRNREVDAIVAYHSDRLHRSPRELEDFIDLLERTGCLVVTTSGGRYDLTTTDGRAMARVIGAFSRKESEDKSRRLKSKHAELAERGMPATHPGYGYDSKWEVLPDQAAHLKDAAVRVLQGESLNAIARLWNEAGITTQRGKKWVPVAIGRTLKAPYIASLRQFHGEVVGPGTWEPILDRVTYERLQLVLRNPARRMNRVARRYLLMGLVFCAACTKQMEALPNAEKVPRYVCRRPYNGDPAADGCYRTMSAPDFEAWVVALVHAALAGGKFARHSAGLDDEALAALLGEIGNHENRLLEFADDLTEQRISRAEWLRLREGTQRQLDVVRRQLARAAPRDGAGELVPAGRPVEESWQALSFDQRRAVLCAVLDRIEIGPAIKGRNFFDPTRVTVLWRA